MTQIDPKLLARAKHLWSQFPPEARDMPFSEFLKEIVAMADPKKMQEDLMKIQFIKNTKSEIDRVIGRK